MTNGGPLWHLGRHEAQLQALDERAERIESVVVQMNEKLDGLLSRESERKGERRVAGWLGGTVAGAAVSLLLGYLRAKFGGAQ